MRVFALTSLGNKIASTKYEDSDRFRVLSYLKDNKTATAEELDVVGGGRHILRGLKQRGLVRELTT